MITEMLPTMITIAPPPTELATIAAVETLADSAVAKILYNRYTSKCNVTL